MDICASSYDLDSIESAISKLKRLIELGDWVMRPGVASKPQRMAQSPRGG